jgi:23S rRNA (uracil1939-C5)-methyltransferase
VRPKRRPAEILELEIEKLGTEGEGFARSEGRPVLVPEALPGETVRVRLEAGRATLLERFGSSPDRVPPPCRHFGGCGGCVLQHLAPAPYSAFKQRLVREALGRQGLGAVAVAEAIVSPSGSRRRTVFEARRVSAGIVLGFHSRASRDVVDLGECPVLQPALSGLLPALRLLLASLLVVGQSAGVLATAVETGIDLGLELPAEPGLTLLEALAAFAERHDLARLWWRTEAAEPMPVAQRRPVQTRFGAIRADLPPGGFLQATAEGEATLLAAVEAGVGSARRIADLFAGIGTFTLALAEGGAAIHAVESDGAALAALTASAHRAGLVRVTAERRDLEARPLLPAELARYDAIVFDPPRAGARAQAEQLAHSGVPVILGVSCNPATFARDAAILAAGGYRLEAVLPVDQFLWSSHIELVGRFRRMRSG